MATTVQLKADKRTDKGKGVARKLRAVARIPGVLYGKDIEPIRLILDDREFRRALSGHSASTLIIDLLVADEVAVKTLIREIQVDPVSGQVLHVDLNQVNVREAVDVEVPIELVGIPKGVKDEGGVLEHPLRTIEIRCLPMEIPEEIRIDVTGMAIGDSIHVRDIPLASGEILSDPDSTVALVSAPRQEEAPAETDGAVAEPEVVGKKGDDKDKGGDKD